MQINFIKMNGAGNDFAVIDNRLSVVGGQLSAEQIKNLASRDNQKTKGCDQLLVLEKSEKADVFMRIYNADGGQVDACGNATRCIADMLYRELGRLPVTIETNVAILRGVDIFVDEDKKENILVDMNEPKFAWQDIPLAMPLEEATAKIKEKFGMENPIFVSMGNPHVVFFMKELPSNSEVAKIGTAIENYTEIFPERVNVSFAKIENLYPEYHTIFAKTWERGAGLTKSCGTGACAIFSAGNKINSEITTAIVHFESYKNDEQPAYCLYTSFSKEASGHILLGGKIEKEFEGIAEI